ncbi:MAG TPA: OmpA family protein [Saprospiraceae bacterium]|nr:OmpA family protein [Saprospiraceae bacterium]HPI06153.1 OmpA family protein [Saprospiraceae bacterium]
MKALRIIIFLLASCYAGGVLHAQTTPAAPPLITVQVKNEEAVNTAGLEFSPTFYEDGIVLISTNANGVGLKKVTDSELKLPALSILRSRRDSTGALSAPEIFSKELSSIGAHEGPVCFDRTTETVYFSRNAVIGGKDKFAKDKTQKTRIYSSKKVNGVWSEPEPLPFNNNEFDDFHPAISIDGDKLFFASNRPGSLGSTDIYVAYKVGDSWSEPVNLGAGVNTKGREAFPFIHADNTLYFASDATEGGQGGFDMYYALMENNQWTKPVNLGSPFNTSGDDFGLIVDLNKINGYYSTNGSGGKGGDEIFSFHTENGNLDDYLLQNQRVPDRNLDIKVVVTDKASGAAISDADAQVLNYDANNVIGRDEAGNLITIQNVNGQDVIKSMAPDKGINGVTDGKGRFSTEVKPGNYVIIVSKKGYQTKQIRLSISKPGNEVALQLERSSNAAPGKVQWTPSAFNYVTNAPLSGAMFVLTDENGKQDTVVADANGMVDYYLDTNKKYKVDLYQAGRIIGSTEVDTHGAVPGQPLMQNISVAPLLPGTIVELPNIYYNFNDATLRPDGRKDLDLVVSLMRQQPSITVELASHTDCRGNGTYNQQLSQRRADGVVEYMVSRGVERERLKPVGYGESEPRNICQDGVNCTEQEHARNRRTEVRILTGMQGASMIYVNGQMNSPQPIDPTVAAPNKVKHTNTAPHGSVTVTDAQRDSYYVIAGSFLMENRAHNQLATLQAAGYNTAEIVRFPNSSFFSVCVGRFNARREADTLKRQLESANIDAFVRAVQ